jgi:S1-C subfamily serine protease
MNRVKAVAGAAVLAGALGGAGLAHAMDESGSATAQPSAPARTVAAARPAPAKLTPEAIYRRAAPGVVVISATQTDTVPATFFTPKSSQKVQIGGSGFVIDRKGDIVTNDHVVQGATNVRVGFSGGSTYPAKVVGKDASTDLAVIRVSTPAGALHPLRLADSGAVQVGDTVFAIGNPFGLDRTMTAGIVSATGRDIQAPNGQGIPNAIQTDAPINHGNSGGPLLNSFGRVVGINDQIESGGTVDGNVGIGFAIASDTARTIVRQLLTTGHVAHPWLGVEVTQVDPQVASVVRGIPEHGVLVVKTVPGAPAAKAGLEAGRHLVTVDGESVLTGGDTIVAVAGKTVDTPEQLADAIRAHKPGDKVQLEVSRSGTERTVTVTLGNAPGSS